jgi:hypothetical protein
MRSAKTIGIRFKQCWQFSRKVAQAFHIGKKLNRLLDLPRKATITWPGKEDKPQISLKDLKIHLALGIKLLEVEQDRSRKRAFKIYDYKLVPRYPRTQAISFLAQDVLRFFIGSGHPEQNKPAQNEWLDMQDSLQRARTGSIFSTAHTLSYRWIPESYRTSATALFEHSIKGRGKLRSQFHPLKRIRAFFWTRRNYDLLVQAGIMDA